MSSFKVDGADRVVDPLGRVVVDFGVRDVEATGTGDQLDAIRRGLAGLGAEILNQLGGVRGKP